MIRGTTPTHTFTLPFPADVVKKCNITYAQAGQVVLKKTEQDCQMAENSISLKLTQEETLKFDSEQVACVQLHVLTNANAALVSEPSVMTVKACLDNEVLEWNGI